MSTSLSIWSPNPDSDAIKSSVAFYYLAKTAYGLDTEAELLGHQMKETESKAIIFKVNIHLRN